jgi:hypothetical protein
MASHFFVSWHRDGHGTAGLFVTANDSSLLQKSRMTGLAKYWQKQIEGSQISAPLVLGVVWCD